MKANLARQNVPFADGDQRDETRCPITMEAKCREYGSFRTEVYLIDLSANGCKVETSMRIRPGQRIWLTLNGLESRLAYVRWSDHGTMGCQFDEPLHNAVVERLTSRHSYLQENAHSQPRLNT